MFMRIFTAALAAIATVGIVAALSGNPASAAEPTCGLNNGQKATGEPIPLGAILGLTGPENFGYGGLTAKAYFDCVNENGGINGRPIEFHIEDDGWDPAKSAAAAAKLVDDIGVYAMVGSGSFVDCTANNKLYEEKNVLVVASIGIPRDCFFAPNYAQTNAGPRISNLGAAQYVVDTFGSKNIVCISPNIPGVGEFSCDGIKEWGKAKGITYNLILVDPGATDVTATLLQAMSFNPDFIQLSQPLNGVVAFLKAAEEQGLGEKVKFAAPTSAYSADFPKEIGDYWSGKMYVQLELEPLDKGTPDMENWYAILEKYGTPDIRRETFAQAGFLAAKYVTELMLKMDAASINRESLTKALREGKDVFRSDVQCGPWYFGPGKRHNPNHAGSVAVTQDGGWKTVAPCFEVDDPDIADVLADEKALGL
jgi:branched-chain amino acid transport system substrate-binding protein